jgi:5-methylcytosine-specific restriction endonuclease McrA
MSFKCEKCNFICNKQSDWLRHLKTRKHRKYDEPEQIKPPPSYACGICDKVYTNRSSLWYHIKKHEKIEAQNAANVKLLENAKKGNIKKIRKKLIPLTLKRKVWEQQIGEDIGKSKCLCCRLTDITQMSFHCGHIISEANGGEIKLDNLRPICQSCNSSMGTVNMDDFINKYGLTVKEVAI